MSFLARGLKGNPLIPADMTVSLVIRLLYPVQKMIGISGGKARPVFECYHFYFAFSKEII
jgi:hypothetical protein